jgi:hypothetical protein
MANNYPSDAPGLLSTRPLVGNGAPTAAREQGVKPSPMSPELNKQLSNFVPELAQGVRAIDRQR